MKFRPLTTLVLTLAMASPAAAYTVKGNVQCRDVVLEDANERFREAIKWWVLGYFSGRNYERDADTGKDMDGEALYAHVLNYCREHLGNDVVNASKDLYDRPDLPAAPEEPDLPAVPEE